MSVLEKNMQVLTDVASPTGSPATIFYAGPGEGDQLGMTRFHVMIDDFSYGIFTVRGDFSTLEQARARLLQPIGEGAAENAAEFAVRHLWVHIDANEYYALG
ncbi:hypothetical protein [Sporomusa termitida]|uniref:Uncharacterized protein n=1 Tax=Sporomusa termitida TaxID=2377 RepID=A0A517DTP4_9FIRM|nr:hypothetical protein [Sporomusa termitida]QDR80720.1 hypothetical protein SPTER_20510 [Sporomusa termitida]